MNNEAEVALQAFHQARQERLEKLLSGSEQLSPDLIARDREAICRHAQAVRAHAERLARFGR